MKHIFDYFRDEVEYPSVLEGDILPYNVVWSYVSSTFLNGIVNYKDKYCAVFQLDKYTAEHEEVTAQIEVDGKWQTFKGSKFVLRDMVLKGNAKMYHTNFSCFEDDIILLSELDSNDEYNKFIFYWFDCDVSDCSVGRILTTDSKEEVIQSIRNYLEDSIKSNENKKIQEGFDNGIVNYTELPLSFLSGWIKF